MSTLKKWLSVLLISLFLSFGCVHQRGYYDDSPAIDCTKQIDVGVYGLFSEHIWLFDGTEVKIPETGTCFAYGDYIITARHAAMADEYMINTPFGLMAYEGARLKERRAWIEHDGEEITLELVFDSKDYDIAVFKRPEKISVIPFKFGESAKLERGDWVYLTGHAYKWMSSLLAVGVMSGYGEDKKGLTKLVPAYQSVIIFNIDANPGHSGSPIYTLRDGKLELVGVVSGTIPYTGIAFGVGIDAVKNMINAHENGYGYDE